MKPGRAKSAHYIPRAVFLGAILGLGAPLGYLIYSFFLINPGNVIFTQWCLYVLSEEKALLAYLTVPTIVMFGLFGYYHGVQEKRLAFKADQMDHFLHMVVHDISAPLAVIKEGANLIHQQALGPINNRQERMLKAMERQVGVMTGLVKGLMDIHKAEAERLDLHLVPSEIQSVVNHSLSEMDLLLKKKNIRVNSKSELGGPANLKMDVFRIRQLIRNIVGNAIKNAPENGLIAVNIFRNSRNEIELNIFNEGPLIPEELIAKIFDKFAQANQKDRRLGHGLGLAICKNIVDSHQGRIWAENVKPDGVCFHVSFPQKLNV